MAAVATDYFRDLKIAASLKLLLTIALHRGLLHFRDLKIAASLKLQVHPRHRSLLRHFRDLKIAASLKQHPQHIGQTRGTYISAILRSRPH